MEEDNKKNKIISRLPLWIKNPYVLIGSIITIFILGYLVIPHIRTMKSPFTQYKPLPIDSAFITYDSTTIMTIDTTTSTLDSSAINKQSVEIQEEQPPVTDSSNISNLFKLNTDYHELDPNQQLGRISNEDPDDFFAQLILGDLSDSEKETLQEINFQFGIKPIIHILSSTAVKILAGDRMQYHLDIIEAIEQSVSIQGIIISDNDQRVLYATNNKYKTLFLRAVFPGRSFSKDNLDIQEMDGNQLIAFPVHHPYGKIGMIILIVED